MLDGSAAASARARVRQGGRNRILYVTPEIADFVKAGGLGDVSAAEFDRLVRPESMIRPR